MLLLGTIYEARYCPLRRSVVLEDPQPFPDGRPESDRDDRQRNFREDRMFKRAMITAALSALLSVPAAAQQPGEISYHDESMLPAGKKGEQIEKVIEAFNSNDPERVKRLVETEFTAEFRGMAPLAEHLNVFRQFYRETGGLDFHSIRTYVPAREGETVVILKDRNFDAWRAFTVWFDDSDEYRIAGIRFNDARTPTDVEEPRLSEAQALEEAARIVRRICERDAFSGTVLIARTDEVLFTHACGEASKRFHVPNDLETRFNLGSMNKMFTATAIAQLVERGVISYDDPISEYVDETWLPRQITDKVTVHHLLSHTSGLGSYFNDTYWNSSRELFRDVDDYKPLVVGDTLAFEPGERFLYSNTGMLLLGVVIENATGQDYFAFIRQNIYEPAGMQRSDSYEMDYPVENLAIGYDPDPSSEYGWQNNLYKHVIKGGPAGGGFSTVGDLERFASALMGGKLVSRESLETMWTDKSGAGYGYGFGIREGPLGRVVGHSGGFSGISANLSMFVDAGYVVAVMSNYGGAASPLAAKIQDLLERTGD
jgi:CubicO group peptidase (beta-lactamase class C family)